MSDGSYGKNESAIDRWNRLHQTLASQERRMIIYSLKDVPKERQVPLPDAAITPDSSLDIEELSIQLKHLHLPQLTDAGYIRWSEDPFYVQRGPSFEEVEVLFKLIHGSIDQFPETLINGCEIYEEMYQEVV